MPEGLSVAMAFTSEDEQLACEVSKAAWNRDI